MNLLHNWNREYYSQTNGQNTKVFNAYEDKTIWWDAKTTTVEDALHFSNDEYALGNLDCGIDLLLLIAHEHLHGIITLQLTEGMYLKKDGELGQILQNRYNVVMNTNTYQSIEGELFAFSFVNDIKLMQIYND